MFAQTNYPQPMASGGTIAERGGLLTAFSNLLEYYQEGVDPVTLDHFFTQQGVDPVLNWATIREYDGDITVTGQGVGGYPSTVPAIVRSAEGYYLVTDTTSIYSLSGESGAPLSIEEWASYNKPERPSEPKLPPTVYVENEVDGIAYKRLQTAPQRMYVINPKGADKLDFGANIKTFRDFAGIPDTHKAYGQEVRIMGTAHHPIIPTGQDFYMDMDDWGNFTGTGHVANLQGYLLGDLAEAKPSPLVKAPTITPRWLPQPAVIPVRMTDIQPQVSRVATTPADVRFQYLQDDREPVRYRVMRRCIIQDYGWEGKPQEILRGKTIKILGSFRYKGRVFLLPALDNPDIPRFKYWYGVPEVDINGNRIIEELPDYSDVEQTVAEAQAESAPRQTTVLHYITYYQEKLSHTLERHILKIKGK